MSCDAEPMVLALGDALMRSAQDTTVISACAEIAQIPHRPERWPGPAGNAIIAPCDAMTVMP